MEPARRWGGIVLYGAGALTVRPPATAAPVQKSYQAPAGR
jgi:hypothetical protein